ncbi:hypothetical protein [Niveispirillum fermenti]|uniref:hypothetical protein n=1 Tax=Niveispirillum fermenti TaxID=1233113 RepID=UPI003A8AB1FA
MPGMMMRLSFSVRRLLLPSVLMFVLPVGALAQNSIGPLPDAGADRPPVTRAPLRAPARPDLSVPPLPAAPDQGDIPPAPVAELPPPRVPGLPDGAAPARLPADQSTLVYAPGADVLPAGTDAVLADIVARLRARPSERLELRAHATGPADRAGDGRRIALLRVRALRDRLVQQGLDPLRLLVFAEASPPDAASASPPPDRIDLVIRQ